MKLTTDNLKEAISKIKDIQENPIQLYCPWCGVPTTTYAGKLKEIPTCINCTEIIKTFLTNTNE
jgi:hypothetical protein